MLLESQEEGYLARIYEREAKQTLRVGTPIAVLCEEEDEVCVCLSVSVCVCVCLCMCG